MDVEVNSPDETEERITSSYEFLPPLNRCKCEDINSKEYFKEVKRMMFNNMDLCGSLSKLSVLNFDTKYRKELKRNYDRADPLFDAWMTITGKQRPEFDVQMFKKNNPSVSGKADEIRAKCGVRLSWIDREEEKKVYTKLKVSQKEQISHDNKLPNKDFVSSFQKDLECRKCGS